jgi:hypothetical protein
MLDSSVIAGAALSVKSDRLLGLAALNSSSADATIIDTSDMTLVATADTLGAYDNAGLE